MLYIGDYIKDFYYKEGTQTDHVITNCSKRKIFVLYKDITTYYIRTGIFSIERYGY